jgi:UDP-N-acetylglucosamine acyltransferase
MAIDPTARVADGARFGDSVEVGPYCLVGPQVELAPGVRLLAHINVTGATTIGEGTIVYPFSSLGTPPQSVHYRGGPGSSSARNASCARASP